MMCGKLLKSVIGSYLESLRKREELPGQVRGDPQDERVNDRPPTQDSQDEDRRWQAAAQGVTGHAPEG